MPSYGARSRGRLATAHPDLQEVFNEVINHMDITILESFREKDRQNKLFADGKSQLRFPKSNHNQIPSEAIDAAPYPVDWEDRERFFYMAGLIIGIAEQKGIVLRWGGNWKRDCNFKDNDFDDLPHFELI